MSRPDEGLIHTWLDGECSPEESARIEQLVATDPLWAAAVAEARGLIAASSRIVGALDAVPRAMPSGSRAAPARVSRPGFRVRPWMGMAAGLALLAGTAYVLNDAPQESFAPVAAEDAAAPPAPPPSLRTEAAAGASTALSAQTSAPTAVPAAAPAGPVVAAAPPSVAPPPPAFKAEAAPADARTVPAASPVGRGEELGGVAREREAVARRGRALAEPSRGAPTIALQDASPAPQPMLAGCWRVSAPPDLLGVLRDPVIARQVGDTIVLRTARGEVPVVRSGDRLAGGLVAVLDTCPTSP
jgi:hypothetical protein